MSRLKGIEKRRPKPLPTIETTRLDYDSEKHVTKLISCWLQELELPMSWVQVLLDKVVLKLFETFQSHHTLKKEEIHVQFFSTNTPGDSKFLKDVYHGNSLLFGKRKETKFPV